MQLDENYLVKKEKDCVTLVYEKTWYDDSKKRVVTSKDQWYFNNVNSALKKYLNQVVDACEEIKEVVKKIEEFELALSKLDFK